MRLIENLGYSKESGATFGLYECPKCLNTFKARTGDVKQGKTTKCKTCADKPRVTQEDVIMELVKVFSKRSMDNKRNYTFVTLKCPVCGKEKDYQAANAKRKNYTECSSCRLLKQDTGTKECTKCGKVKDKSEFSKTVKTSSGLYSRCRECRAEESKQKRDALTSEEKYARYAAKSYSITKEEAITLRAENGMCGICKKEVPWSNRHLDHCHTTGKIRGILCPTCNLGLGSFYDSIENLQNAIKWLEDANV